MNIKKSYPRFPESNWWQLRDQFGKTIPTVINVVYLKSLLRLTSDQAARNLISPLKRLGLIDDDNKPTDLANEWRNDDTYAEACQKMLENAYPQALLELFSGEEIDKSGIVTWFKTDSKLGDVAAKKSSSFYILLNKKKSEKIGQKKERKKPEKRLIPPTGEKVTEKKVSEKIEKKEEEGKESLIKNEEPSIYINLQIHISAESSNEQIDKIFESIAKHLRKK